MTVTRGALAMMIIASHVECCNASADASLQYPLMTWTQRRSAHRANAECARVDTITAFRAYAGAATCIVLTHPVSGGRFDAGGCSTDDGGVCVRSATGAYYLRPLGTPRVWHADYYISAAATDQDAISALTYHSRADAGAIVIFDRVYDQADALNLYDNITYRGGGLRRACQVSTVLTEELSPVGVDLVVASTSGFASNRAVFIAPSNGYEPSIWASYIDGEPSDATHMRISAPLGYAAGAGWRISTVWPQIRQIESNGTQGPTPGMVIEDMEFDGNAVCNTYVHDWRYQDIGAIKSATVTGVYVHDTPAEAFTICGTTLLRSRFVDLAGSIAHKSCSEPGHADVIDEVTTIRTNQLGDALLGHSEGTITLSANAGHITVTRSAFSDGREGFFGTLNGDDAGSVATGNTIVRHARWCYRVAGDAIDIASNTYVDTPQVGGCP